MDPYLKAYEEFTELEIALDLDTLRLNEANPWELIRFFAYNELMKARGLFGEGQHRAHKGVLKKLKEHSAPFFGHDPITAARDRVIVIGHQRRIKTDQGLYRDVYCEPYLEIMQKNNIPFNYMERPYSQPAHFTPTETKKVFYLDNILLGKHDSGSKENFVSLLKTKAAEFCQELGMPSRPLMAYIDNAGSHFSAGTDNIRRLLKKIVPKKIVMAIGYVRVNQLISLEAKKMGIEVIEIQHGIISKFHMGYSYEKWRKNPPAFPDKILLFGDDWTASAPFPIDKKELITLGAPRFQDKKKISQGIGVRKNILFISQGSIGENIISAALELEKAGDEELHIGVKLHPAEVGRKSKIYDQLRQNRNIEIFDGNEDIYALYEQYGTAVGGYSTALLEAREFGLDAYCLNVPGVHYFDRFITNKSVSFISSIDHLAETLKKQGDSKNRNTGNIFSDFRPDKFLDLVI